MQLLMPLRHSTISTPTMLSGCVHPTRIGVRDYDQNSALYAAKSDTPPWPRTCMHGHSDSCRQQRVCALHAPPCRCEHPLRPLRRSGVQRSVTAAHGSMSYSRKENCDIGAPPGAREAGLACARLRRFAARLRGLVVLRLVDGLHHAPARRRRPAERLVAH
eukprot:6112094-Alexandrium_andersonii.AAC.1